jgi:hypothetical protein
LQAIVTLEYGDIETAAAIAKAVAPDNSTVPIGLKVETQQKKFSVITQITLEGKFATFISTIDDLLECASAAEKTLRALKTKQI